MVIDFEYASANTPGLEFANHFTEWCYNYHDPDTAWKCNIHGYPKPDEQDRFARAYVRHRPQFNVSTPQLRPQPDAQSPHRRPPGPSSSISNFMLDARTPASTESLQPVDAECKAAEDAEVASLLHETRLWRLANSAQWVAWGIVQAKVPGLPNFSRPSSPDTTPKPVINVSASPDEMTPTGETDKQLSVEAANRGSDKLSAEAQAMREDIDSKRPDPNEENDEAEEEEFDYLRYARDRAMFFWGDAVQLGLVKAEELPEDVQKSIKAIEY